MRRLALFVLLGALVLPLLVLAGCSDTKPLVEPTVELTFTPNLNRQGANPVIGTLKWTSTNAARVFSSNFGAATVSGEKAISKAGTYTITVSSLGGAATDSIDAY